MVTRAAFFLLLSALILAGCNRNPYMNGVGTYGGAPGMTPGANQTAVLDAQVAEMNRRLQLLDENNRQLTTQLAQSQQQSQVYRDRADLVQRQLQDVTAQLQQAKLAQNDAMNQVRGIQASTSFRGGATITPNSSLTRQIDQIRIPGATAVVEGDVIRVRIPADQLFAAGSAQLTPNAAGILDPISEAILRSFPRQRVGIEGHTDNGPLYGGSFSSVNQLSTAQASAVYDQMVKRNRIPPNQLFTIGHGANHPRADNQTAVGRAENRRIEVVIYPETY